MPIDYKEYHPKWTLIVRLIRLRVIKAFGIDCCEGSPVYPDCHAENGKPHPETGSTVVLTTAHVDGNKDNNRFWNLKRWCQRCHLRHDLGHHIMNRKYGRKHTRSHQGKLFSLLIFSIILCSFVVRIGFIYGNTTHNRSSKSGRHTGESPEAPFVVSTESVRSDLPLLFTQNLFTMRTEKSNGQNLSKPPSIHEVVNQFFQDNGDPQHLDKELWQLTVAAFNSRDTDDLTPLERANLLCTYRAVSTLLFQLKDQQS
ncbi:MAG: hypothetical protein K8H85_10290 [Cyclobacteriaceae bacterium]|nr:hypothetical protein [Cyclobacteriaceae bacterium]